MKTEESKPGGALCREILAEARRAQDEMLRRAEQDAGAILAQARADAEKTRRAQLACAREEAVRQRELILATVPVEAVRLRAARAETLLQSVCEEARNQLSAGKGFDYRATLMALAAEAVGQMAGDAFVLKLSPADRRAFGDALAAFVKHRAARPALRITIEEHPGPGNCGVVVEDGEGRQVWDNRLLPRLQRLWPELRRQIAAQTALITTAAEIGGAA